MSERSCQKAVSGGKALLFGQHRTNADAGHESWSQRIAITALAERSRRAFVWYVEISSPLSQATFNRQASKRLYLLRRLHGLS